MYLVTENRLIYQSHGRIHYTDNLSDTAQMKKSTLSTVGNQSVLDPKLWPADVNYCAYFSEGDLWLQNLAKGRLSTSFFQLIIFCILEKNVKFFQKFLWTTYQVKQ